jgi:hypothetical protein
MNLYQALVKLVKPQLKFMQISSRNINSLLFINKYRNKLNENLKTNSLNSKMSISSTTINRKRHDLKIFCGNQTLIMSKPSLLYEIYYLIERRILRFRIDRQMSQLDKSFCFDSFMIGAQQVMSKFF